METKTAKSKTPLMIRVFPWIFILGGIILFIHGVDVIWHALASKKWPTVQGVIQSSSVKWRSGSEDSADRPYVDIRYNYEVNGTTYPGNRVGFGEMNMIGLTSAQHIVNRYPSSKKVDVYYQPDDPEVAVLEPGVKAYNWFDPIFGLVCFVPGVFMAIFFPKMNWKRSID